MKKNTTTELHDSDASCVITWAMESHPAKSTTLDALAVKELMHLLSDYVLNTTEAIQVFMVLDTKDSPSIIKLERKNSSK